MGTCEIPLTCDEFTPPDTCEPDQALEQCGGNAKLVCSSGDPNSLPEFCQVSVARQQQNCTDQSSTDPAIQVTSLKCDPDDPNVKPLYCDGNGTIALCDADKPFQPFCDGKDELEARSCSQKLGSNCNVTEACPDGRPPDWCQAGYELVCEHDYTDGPYCGLDPESNAGKAATLCRKWDGNDHVFGNADQDEDCEKNEYCDPPVGDPPSHHRPVLCYADDKSKPPKRAQCKGEGEAKEPPLCSGCDRDCEMLQVDCGDEQPTKQPTCKPGESKLPTVCDGNVEPAPRFCGNKPVYCDDTTVTEMPTEGCGPDATGVCQLVVDSVPRICFIDDRQVNLPCDDESVPTCNGQEPTFCAFSVETSPIDSPRPPPPVNVVPLPPPPADPGPTDPKNALGGAMIGIIATAVAALAVAAVVAAILVWQRLRRRVGGDVAPAGASRGAVVVHTVAEEVGQDLMREFRQALTGALGDRDLYPTFQDGSAAGPNELVVVAHQVGERLYVNSILPRLQELQRRGVRVVLVVLIPHNPSSAVAPRRSRNMLEDQAAAKIRSYTTGYYDLYFWDSSMRAHDMQGLNFNNMSSLVSLLDLEA